MATSEFVRKQLRTLIEPHPVGTHVRNHANKNAWIGVVTHVGVTHEGRSLPPMCVDVLILVDRFGVPTKSQLYVAAHSAFFEVVPDPFAQLYEASDLLDEQIIEQQENKFFNWAHESECVTINTKQENTIVQSDPAKKKSVMKQFYVVMEDEYFRHGNCAQGGDPSGESGVGIVQWCESAEEACQLCAQLNKILNQHRLFHDPQPNQLISK